MIQAHAAAGPSATYDDTERSRTARRLSRSGRPRLPMLRVLWRQHRVALSLALAIYAAAAAALGISGPILREVASDFGPRAWRTSAVVGYSPRYPDLAMHAIPLLAALFIGVQLGSREAESGTAAFAWTQGYGKNRWLLGKLAAAGAVLIPAAIALGLVFGWWYQVYVPATGYFRLHAFALYAPALAGWTLAGLTLGMAVGAVTRREGISFWPVLAGWALLHAAVTLGSPATPAGQFWTLQVAQLAILVALSAAFTGVTLWVLRDAPAAQGMPRLPRSLPWSRRNSTARLASQLARRRPVLGTASAAWRQHRIGLLAAVGLLAGYAVILLVTGVHIHAEPPRLRPGFAAETSVYEPGPSNGNLFPPVLLPFLIGAFLGAALTTQDRRRGTAEFAWTQGVTKTRWITGQLIGVGLALAAVAVAAGLVFAWWDQPYLTTRITDPTFGLYPPVFAGWTLASFAVAACFGAWMQHRTAAAVTTLICAITVAAANALSLRPGYLPPAFAINRPAPPGAYFLSWYLRQPDRQPLSRAASNRAWHVLDTTHGWSHVSQVLARVHAISVQSYVPASRFWPYQAIETAGLLAITLLFGTAAIMIIRRSDA